MDRRRFLSASVGGGSVAIVAGQPHVAVADAWPQRPNAVAVTTYEGGLWVPFQPRMRLANYGRTGNLVHAIVFDNGDVWDAHNGWRSKRYPKTWERA